MTYIIYPYARPIRVKLVFKGKVRPLFLALHMQYPVSICNTANFSSTVIWQVRELINCLLFLSTQKTVIVDPWSIYCYFDFR